MKKFTTSLLCAGLITTTAIAEDICNGAYQAQNYSQATECYIKQLKIERSFNNLEMAGLSFIKQGRYAEALPYLKEAEKKALTSSDYVVLYSSLALVYGRMEDSVQQLAYAMKFLDLSLKSGGRKNLGIAYSNLGVYYFKKDQPQKALEYYERALEYQEESERATTYGNMAVTYEKLNNFTKTEEMYQKTVEIDQKTGNYTSLGAHKKTLGVFYFNQKRYIEARKALEEARTISHNVADISTKAHALSYLSLIDYQEGKIKPAKEKADEALPLARQSGDALVLSDAQYVWNAVNGK